MPDTLSSTVVYLVQQWHWRFIDHFTQTVEADDPRQDVQENPDRPGSFELGVYVRGPDEGGLPVKVFTDLDRAEAFCREQEQARRARTNPFRYGWGMDSRTSLDEGRLRDWLLDAGLTPPGHEGEERPEVIRKSWQAWWRQVRKGLTPQKQERLAQAVNNALAGVQYGQPDAPGPNDLAWLEGLFERMNEWTPEQRSALFMGMIGLVSSYPDNSGERQDNDIEEKWRDWWDHNRAAMTAYQREHVWQAMDKVRFFEVVELREGE